MRENIMSMFCRFSVFTGSAAEVEAAARRSEDANGQYVCYGDGFALVVADGHGVMGVYATHSSLYNAVEAAWNEDDMIRKGLA